MYKGNFHNMADGLKMAYVKIDKEVIKPLELLYNPTPIQLNHVKDYFVSKDGSLFDPGGQSIFNLKISHSFWTVLYTEEL